jgi:hypothetical protein
MPRTEDILSVIGAIVAAIAFVLIIRWRRRDHTVNIRELAEQEVCEHLRPALERVLQNDCRVTRVGQNHRDLPLEIHVAPPFDPKAIYDELKLADPVFVSERNVLYCKEDWCELHPKP